MDERFGGYFKTLYEVVKAINSSLDPKVVLNQVAEKVSWAMDVKACSIRLLSSDKRFLEARASYGLSQGYLRKGKIEVSKSGIDQEVLAGNNVYIADAYTDSRFQYPEEAKAEGIHSVMAVPLPLQGREITGVLRVYSSTEREFAASEIEFLNAIAELCAMAIHNALAHNKLKHEHELTTEYNFILFDD